MKKKKQSIGQAIALGSAAAGAVLGAAAVLLSDKKNQEKIKKVVDEISSEAVKFGKSVKNKTQEYTKSTEKEEKKAEKVVGKAVKNATPKVYTPRKK